MTLPNIDIQEKRALLAELSEALSQPDNLNNQKRYISLSSQYKKVQEIVSCWEEVSQCIKEIEESKSLLADPAFANVARKEIELLETRAQKALITLELLTSTPLKDDEKPAIMEIRAGTGGAEASLFAEELMRMYLKYFSNENISSDIVHMSHNEAGGIKEATIELDNPYTYGKLRFESGVHRVQRVPTTESSGRIHTSAVSIVFLPITEDADVEIRDQDIRIDVFRSSGPGGQSVNTTDSAVRITHLPTGLTVSCQDGKSQHKNKEKALSILRSKLYILEEEKRDKESKELRTSAIKDGDRSAKIRTFNFPQGRITDHRVKTNWFNISEVMEGKIGEIIEEVNKQIRIDIAKLDNVDSQ